MGDEDDDVPKRKKKGFSSQLVLLLFCLLFGLIVGILVAHFYIEPILAPQTIQELAQCKAQKDLLNIENQNCLTQLYDANGLLKACENELGKCTNP